MAADATETQTQRAWEVGRSRRAPWILLALLAVVPFGNAAFADFVFDDVYLFTRHAAVQAPLNPWRLVTAHYWGSIEQARLWRPVATLSFGIDHAIAGNAPFWPHLVNCFLHAGVTLGLAALAVRLSGRRNLGFLAGALFAVHPMHTEAVTWISGRAELLAALFSLGALLLASGAGPAHATRRSAWVFAASLLAIGSKESAVMVSPILLYLAWAFPARRSTLLRSAGIALVAFLVYLPMRHGVLGTWAGPDTDPMDNPMVGLGAFERLPTALDAAGRYLLLFLWPARLSIDYSAPVLGIVRGVTPHLVIGLLATAGLVFLALRRRSSPEGWGSGITLLTFALASNIPMVIGTIFGERLFYLPSAGLTIVASAAALRAVEARPRLRVPALAILGLVLAAGTVRAWIRNADYRSDARLYAAEARSQPRSPKMRYNHALQLGLDKRHEESLAEGYEALRLNPSSRESRDVIANALVQLGRVDEAIAFLESQLAKDPADPGSRSRLVRLLEDRDPARANAIADAAIEDATIRTPETLAVAAKRAQDRGEYARAAEMWRILMKQAPKSVDSGLFLGYCLLKLARPDEARAAYAEALRRAPGNAEAANGVAWCLLEAGGSPAEAVRFAEQAVRAAPDQAYMHDTLARALLAAGRCADAKAAAEKGLTLDPESASLQERLRAIDAQCK